VRHTGDRVGRPTPGSPPAPGHRRRHAAGGHGGHGTTAGARWHRFLSGVLVAGARGQTDRGSHQPSMAPPDSQPILVASGPPLPALLSVAAKPSLEVPADLG